jgi:hypothetical protein
MILWVIVYWGGEFNPTQPYYRRGAGILIFILLVVLGWAVFGGPVKG